MCRPDIDEDFGGLGSNGAVVQPPPPIPMDARLQLTLAAINTLFRLLHSIQDLARLVWSVGGKDLVNRIVLLASLLKDSFEEAATKILVVFFSHKHIQDAVRDSGAPPAAIVGTCRVSHTHMSARLLLRRIRRLCEPCCQICLCDILEV